VLGGYERRLIAPNSHSKEFKMQRILSAVIRTKDEKDGRGGGGGCGGTIYASLKKSFLSTSWRISRVVCGAPPRSPFFTTRQTRTHTTHTHTHGGLARAPPCSERTSPPPLLIRIIIFLWTPEHEIGRIDDVVPRRWECGLRAAAARSREREREREREKQSY
jgi:hypothetical protein